MKIETNVSLKPYNTFGVEARANRLIRLHSTQDVFVALSAFRPPYRILGGGSNIILSEDVPETILKNEIKGIEVIDEDESQCLVRVGGGENWHQFVLWTLSHGLGGLENLALIPGTVGAAPMQNIGAYGVEQEQFFHSLSAVDLESGLTKQFFRSDCKFGYRDSIFKSSARDQYFIARVTYLLKKEHQPNVSYKDVHQYLEEAGQTSPGIADVAKAVIDIRTKKLPDPAVTGNAGSFFKNPVVSAEEFRRLKAANPDIVHYPLDNWSVKLSAAWMIDQCGFKGMQKGHTGTYKNQALVLVNNGGASGKEILDFALEIQNKVYDTFGVELTPEVNIW